MPSNVPAECAACGDLLPRGSWSKALSSPVRCRKCRYRPRVSVQCAACEKRFLAYQCKVETGRGKFCSKECQESRAFKERTFWSHVDKSGECWIWTGSRNAKGYGQASFEGRVQPAHRVAWQLTHGPIAAGVLVCHTCDHPPCVRPDHLWLGTNDDNMRDMVAKGRAPGLPGERNPRAKLSAADARAIRLARPERPHGDRRRLAREYGVALSTISKIWARTTWKHVAQH